MRTKRASDSLGYRRNPVWGWNSFGPSRASTDNPIVRIVTQKAKIALSVVAGEALPKKSLSASSDEGGGHLSGG